MFQLNINKNKGCDLVTRIKFIFMDKAVLVKKLQEAFNDFMNIESTTYQMVLDELLLIELKAEPKNLVLNKFIKSVLEIN